MVLEKKYTNKQRFLKNWAIFKRAGLLHEVKSANGYYILVVYPH